MAEAQAMAVKGGMGNTFGHDKVDELDGQLDQRNPETWSSRPFLKKIGDLQKAAKAVYDR